MESNILFIIIGAIALTSGLLLGKFVFAKNTSKLIQDAEDQAKKVIADGQLQAFQHRGFWQPMDTLRDKVQLEELWASGKAPWKLW